MARKQFLINYHTSGVTNPSVENVKKGEIVVKHNDEKPSLVILKNNNEWAEFIDENAIDTKLSAVTVDLTGKVEGVASDLKSLSANTHNAIASAKAEAVADASAYTDTQVAAAEGRASAYTDTQVAAAELELNGKVENVANSVSTLSANTHNAIASAKAEAVADASAYTDTQVAAAEGRASAYTDTQVAAAKSILDKAVEDVADAVEALSGAVDTKFKNYATSGDTETAIGVAKDAAIGAASAYTDAQVASAVTVFETKIENAASDVSALSGNVVTLIGNDSGKTVRNIANEELAAQLLSGKADADFKTLKDLAAWLEDHPESVAEINANITALSAATGTLHTNIETVAQSVEDLSANTHNAIASAKAEAVADASAYTDTQVAAAEGRATAYTDAQVASAKSILDKAVEDVADAVEALSADTHNAIASAKTEAIAAASAYTDTQVAAAESRATAYTDAQVASAKTELNKAIEDVAKDVEALEKLSGATESAIQVIAVDGIEGVEVVPNGTTRTIDFSSMIIDGGEY